MISKHKAVWARVDAELRFQNKTWSKLAEAVSVTKQACGNWGAKGIPSKHVRAIADFLGKTIDWVELGPPVAKEATQGAGLRPIHIATLEALTHAMQADKLSDKECLILMQKYIE